MKRRKIGLVLPVLFLYALFAAAAFGASLSDDNVLSENLKEADGTSGQNTNAGAGVKTDHIQDAAVTVSKIADTAVTNAKVADGAISTTKIVDGAVTDAQISGVISGSKLGTHSHNGSDLADGTVTTTKIQDGAVTDAKITGTISASKISSTGLNADTVDGRHASDLAPVVHMHNQADVNGLEVTLAGKSEVTHNHDILYQQKYGKVAVVAQTGGDYTDPVAALSDIATWCGSPSATNPCLVKIMPGIYGTGLSMTQYVDIEGSGSNTTSLQGYVNGAPNSEIRSLRIEPVVGGVGVGYYSLDPGIFKVSHASIIVGGAESYNYGINHDGGNLKIEDTDISVSNPAGNVFGVRFAWDATNLSMNNVTINVSASDTVYGVEIYLRYGSGQHIELKHVKINSSGGGINCGIRIDGGTTQITDSYVKVDNSAGPYALEVRSGTVTTSASTLIAATALHNWAYGTVKVNSTQLDGAIDLFGSTGVTKIFSCYDSNFDPIPNQ